MKELSDMKPTVSISKVLIVIAAMLFSGAALSACNTWSAFEKDVESGWDSVFGDDEKEKAS